MSTAFRATFLSVLLAASASAQPPSRLFTRAALPPREALERLNLVQSWYAVAPVDGRRDGLLSVQLAGRDLLVQTRSGVVMRLDAETGRTYWRVAVGAFYQSVAPLGYSSLSVFAVNNNYLYALDRKTGDVQWRFPLPGGISAPPVADDEMLFLGMADTRLYAYRLPILDVEGRFQSELDSARARGTSLPPEIRAELSTSDASSATLPNLSRTSSTHVGPRPTLAWATQTGVRLELRPALTRDSLVVVIPSGEARLYAKLPQEGEEAEKFRVTSQDMISVSPGQYDDIVYVGSHDANLYAYDVKTGRRVWRFTAGTPIVRPPIALEKDVYVTAKDKGLARLDRETGLPLWRVVWGRQVLEYNPEADRFLAANGKYVYALAQGGDLLVLDRTRGATLGRFDLEGFTTVVSNETTDRIYLAANNGLIVCLRDRDYPQPLAHRKVVTPRDALEDRLALLVTHPGAPPLPLTAVLKDFAAKHDLKITISERAFKALDKEDMLSKQVGHPAVQQRPVKEVLQKILADAGATSIIVDDTILVVPAGEAK